MLNSHELRGWISIDTTRKKLILITVKGLAISLKMQDFKLIDSWQTLKLLVEKAKLCLSIAWILFSNNFSVTVYFMYFMPGWIKCKQRLLGAPHKLFRVRNVSNRIRITRKFFGNLRTILGSVRLRGRTPNIRYKSQHTFVPLSRTPFVPRGNENENSCWVQYFNKTL